MSNRSIFFSAYCFVAFLLCSRALTAQQPAKEKINSFNALSRSFATPPQQFGSAPLWVWNTDVDTVKISEALKQFKANAFGGVFIHPRAGLITPYLSKEWMDMYQYSIQLAKKIGLDVWIYDENSYPSGFAGGHVPAEMPESFNQGQMLEFRTTDTLPADAQQSFICLKKLDNKFIDITGKTDAEKGNKGEYYLFKKTFYYRSPWYGGFSYVDLMAKGVTEKFIDVTMGAYEKFFGKELGKTVPGVFSDEPNIEVQYPHNIRWTPDLFSTFQKTWGYDLQTNLPCLFEETGEWKKVRHNYYQTLLQLFIDRWSKPFADYTAKKNLEWTGHYWEHEWPNPNHGPDNMAMYAWPQRPGIDMLFNQFNENDMNGQFGNIRSVKELASVANQLDKKRTLSETYGGGGWELSFKDMKRLGDWEFVLGINTLNQHLSFMSIAGARKYDYPQSFSYHEPWWPYYKYLNQYFARLTVALSSGSQFNDILIIEPTTTAWMYYTHDKPNPLFRENGRKFQQFITSLEKSQVEYDLGSENIIRDHGKIEDVKFVIGSRKYTTLVLPPGMENIDMPTFLLLKKYAAAGGKIIQFQPLKTIDGSTSKLLDEFYQQKYSGLVADDFLDEAIIQKQFLNKDFIISQDKKTSGDLYHYRRKLEDGELIFLCNASLENNVRANIKTAGRDLLVMNLFSGNISRYWQEQTQNNISASFDLFPAESILLFVSPAERKEIKRIQPASFTGHELDLQTNISRSADNSLTIDFCDVQIGDALLTDKHVYDAADTVFKKYGFKEGNPWNTSVQFKDNTIKRDTFSKGTGFTASYYFNIKEDFDLSSLKAVVERPELYKVFLNDNELSPIPGKWWIDKDFKIFSIGKFVRQGKNKLSLVANPMSVHAEIESVYILGDFGLASADKGWDIVKSVPLKLGNWKQQGMPMYGQEVVYIKKLNVSNLTKHSYYVALNEWKGTAAVVFVNGKMVAPVALPPYRCDITKFLKKGNNTVEVKLIGSLKNTFGPHHNKPKPGLVSPWHWRYVKKYPSGNEYDLYDYGLMEDFKIVER
jgi:hypothetical protein